jgi:hypothetical protein
MRAHTEPLLPVRTAHADYSDILTLRPDAMIPLLNGYLDKNFQFYEDDLNRLVTFYLYRDCPVRKGDYKIPESITRE